MIDFRYHLVSLISVFLALAVGVVLGAGPLQNSLGTALNDQVTSLRADRNETKTRLEQTEAAVNDRDDYIAAAAGAYLPGALTGRKTVLVVLPEAQGGDIDLVTSQLQTAGATIVGRVSLTTVWADAARETCGWLGGRRRPHRHHRGPRPGPGHRPDHERPERHRAVRPADRLRHAPDDH